MEQDDQAKNNAEIKRNSMIAVVLCILFLFAYLYFEKQQFIEMKKGTGYFSSFFGVAIILQGLFV